MLEVIIIVLIVYIFYYFVSIKRYDKVTKRNKKNKEIINSYEALPAEVKYFVKKYNVDSEKVSYRGLLKLIGIVLGIDIAILSIVLLLLLKDKITLMIIIATIVIIPLYLISLKFVGNYFKKKGLVKNEL